jgi:hypothetical protein
MIVTAAAVRNNRLAFGDGYRDFLNILVLFDLGFAEIRIEIYSFEKQEVNFCRKILPTG